MSPTSTILRTQVDRKRRRPLLPPTLRRSTEYRGDNGQTLSGADAILILSPLAPPDMGKNATSIFPVHPSGSTSRFSAGR